MALKAIGPGSKVRAPFSVRTAIGPLTFTDVPVLDSNGNFVGQEKPGLTLIAASGAIGPHTPATFVITKAGVAAMTLAAPTAGTDDGVVLTITSNTAFAHTITATGLLQTGSANVNVATFAAQPGAGLELMAYNGKWNVMSAVGITFS